MDKSDKQNWRDIDRSASHLPREGGLDDLPLRVSNEGFLLHISPKGVARLAFSARIGRALSHRARSASTKDGLAAAFPSFQARSFSL